MSINRSRYIKNTVYYVMGPLLRNLLSFDVIQKSERLGWMGEKEGALNPKLNWEILNS